MKINTKAKACIMALALSLSSVPVYGASVISATNMNVINQSNLALISSNNGESVSNVDSLDSIFKISFENDNYVTTKFAKIKSNAPVYSQANTISTKIGDIPADSIVVIGEEVGAFSQIFFKDQIGYIQNTYLSSYKAEPIIQDNSANTNNSSSTGKYAVITATTGLNLRQAQSTSSASLLVIPSGAYANLLEDNGSWYKVDYNGKVGYISAQYASITDKNNTSNAVVGNANANNVINYAMKFIGTPYIYGGTNLSVGVDCSGFTYSVFKNFGIELNRSSKDQYLNGTAVTKDSLAPGDLVFFNTGGNSAISHVGIYIGNNQYIHSTDTNNKGVTISSLTSDYAIKTYYGARRVLN